MTTANGLILLAKAPDLDRQTHDELGWDKNMISKASGEPVAKQAKFPYFHDGYVSIDQVMDGYQASEVTKSTIGYALADAEGNVLAEFAFDPGDSESRRAALQKAIAAREHAVVKTELSIEVPDETPAQEPAETGTRTSTTLKDKTASESAARENATKKAAATARASG